MATVKLSDADLIEALTGLNRMLDEIAAGSITCTAATRHRVEGAAVALQAVASGVVPTFRALGTD